MICPVDDFLDLVAEKMALALAQRAEAEKSADYRLRQVLKDAGSVFDELMRSPLPEAEIDCPEPETIRFVKMRDGQEGWRAPGTRFVPPGKVTKARFGVRA